MARGTGVLRDDDVWPAGARGFASDRGVAFAGVCG